MASKPERVDDVERAVDRILETVGRKIVLGLPLGLGKPVELVNALYRRAQRDASISLRILTALSLEKPFGSSRIEQAFLDPFVARVFAGVPDLLYVRDLRENKLPANVEICEFYFRPGSMLGNPHAQMRYVSSNYTHAARDVFEQGCNVVAQLVCRRGENADERLSLSCNPDTGPELLRMLRASGREHMAIALVNQNLPYMAHDAEVAPAEFDLIIDDPRYSSALFPTPKMAVTTPDYHIGLYASSLVRDGGTLQLGIGSLGDAIVYALIQRHARNASYRAALDAIGALQRHGALIERIGGASGFEQGLYGATEMFVDGFWQLMRAGILKRRVYDFWSLQELINGGDCDPNALTPAVLDGFERLGVRVLRGKDFDVLQHHGLFRDDTRYDEGHLIAPDGERVIANVADPAARAVMARCLGRRLRNGIVLHAGFFLGPSDFYAGLREMSQAERDTICMTGVDKTNQLDFNPRLYRAQRRDARFINSGMMATLSGAVCSDGLDNGQVVSGVGGQYNFIAQAHQIPGGRSILMVRSTREDSAGRVTSNIVFNYGHLTIPRHLRDIVITEYGIADLRSRTDAEVAKAMIGIADSRFQRELLAQAQRAGKIERGWTIPEPFCDNTPERLERQLGALRSASADHDPYPAFPFGCDFTDEELVLGKALKTIARQAKTTPKWKLLTTALMRSLRGTPEAMRPYLRRVGLDQPASMQDRVARALLFDALRAEGSF
ncbi:acetyl-CoA hydrolase/transferase C-terminal domain-containing protein [Sinimarinibacterium thermocellulolyticum]|uniref:Acetyl-CoA hydrolase/transferase C-terminal domain-containing protein n=1 Tax=Sinimarinibacterium thermocellulolyticum TaxID=3170016 RepID=A0ABV2ACJ9_9GAMM